MSFLFPYLWGYFKPPNVNNPSSAIRKVLFGLFNATEFSFYRCTEHRKPASVGIYRDSCGVQDSGKRKRPVLFISRGRLLTRHLRMHHTIVIRGPLNFGWIFPVFKKVFQLKFSDLQVLCVNRVTKGKFIIFSLCSIKHHAMSVHGRVEV